jgi:2-keto-4-pentenoate hydratase/2-oxohepta-3-ene-1,7-dioic acid hydratase in catechol pathway
VKLVSYVPRDATVWRLGALAGETHVVPLRKAIEAQAGVAGEAFDSMLALIRAGAAGLDAARGAMGFAQAEGGDFLIPMDNVRLGPPLPDPVALRCCSVFRGHARNARRTVERWRTGSAPANVVLSQAFETIPGYYKGNHLNLIGPEDIITFPRGAAQFDFELELAAIVGRAGIDVPRHEGLRHVFGYSIFNDASARHPQLEEMTLGTGPNKSKDFDGGNVLGPCLVTGDEFDPRAATGIARVNGIEWGRSTAADMAHDWGAILEYRSRAERLYPGEIITSGCFTNCSGIELDRFIAPGDVVELEIPGIGILRNRVGLRPR